MSTKTKTQPAVTLFNLPLVAETVTVAPPSERYFDIVRDNAQIAKGTHFWCSGHLSAIPIAKQSANPRYCQKCWQNIRGESSVENNTPQDPTRTTESALTTTQDSDKGCDNKKVVSGHGEVVLKHPGGRPQKDGEVSRTTDWRRRKGKRARE